MQSTIQSIGEAFFYFTFYCPFVGIRRRHFEPKPILINLFPYCTSVILVHGNVILWEMIEVFFFLPFFRKPKLNLYFFLVDQSLFKQNKLGGC